MSQFHKVAAPSTVLDLLTENCRLRELLEEANWRLRDRNPKLAKLIDAAIAEPA